jgi:hypothetical protein
MICRTCGTEIADKAIVCYRCGTATTDPVRKPVEVRRRRSPALALIVILAAILIALLLARHYHVFGLEYSAYSVYSVADEPVYSVALLIDFRALHA